MRSTDQGWANEYVGTPFVEHGRDPAIGWDCWGLVCFVYREHLGVELPSFDADYEDTEDVARLASLFDGGLQDWDEVDEKQVVAFDGILVHMLGRPSHCAVALGGGLMLHTLHGSGTTIIRLRSHLWHPTGFFRYRSNRSSAAA